MHRERRLSVSEKTLIENLYQKGYSLRTLSNLLGRRKNVIYYHTRKLFGLRYKRIKFNLRLKEELGEFLGALAGDGTISKDIKNGNYSVRIFLAKNEFAYATYLANLTERLFNKKANVWKPRNRSLSEFSIYGKEIIEFLNKYFIFESDKTYTIRLKERINYYPRPLLRGFIRGLIASDGWVGKDRIEFSTISESLSNQFSEILDSFKIQSHIYPQKREYPRRIKYRVRIYGYKNLNRFYNTIGLAEENKLNKLKSIVFRQANY